MPTPRAGKSWGLASSEAERLSFQEPYFSSGLTLNSHTMIYWVILVMDSRTTGAISTLVSESLMPKTVPDTSWAFLTSFLNERVKE